MIAIIDIVVVFVATGFVVSLYLLGGPATALLFCMASTYFTLKGRNKWPKN